MLVGPDEDRAGGSELPNGGPRSLAVGEVAFSDERADVDLACGPDPRVAIVSGDQREAVIGKQVEDRRALAVSLDPVASA